MWGFFGQIGPYSRYSWRSTPIEKSSGIYSVGSSRLVWRKLSCRSNATEIYWLCLHVLFVRGHHLWLNSKINNVNQQKMKKIDSHIFRCNRIFFASCPASDADLRGGLSVLNWANNRGDRQWPTNGRTNNSIYLLNIFVGLPLYTRIYW